MAGINGFHNVVLRLAAQNSIEQTQEHSEIIKAQHSVSQSEITSKNAEREAANAMREGQSYIQIASSAVKVAQSAQGLGQAVATAKEEKASESQMSTQMDSHNAQGLDDTRLGENGPRFGDRFPAEQGRVLADPQRVRDVISRNTGSDGKVNEAAARAEFQRAGFTERESADLVHQAKDGWDSNKAARWAWNHRTPEATEARQKAVENFKQELTKHVVDGLSKNLGMSASRLQERGKKVGEESNKLEDTAAKLADQMVRFNKAMGKIGLDTIRDSKQGQGQKR